MQWTSPIYPQSLKSDYSQREFAKRGKIELKTRVGELCTDLFSKYSAIPWDKFEESSIRDLSNFETFTSEKLDQFLNEAKAVISGDCTELSNACFKLRDELLDIEKNESDDGLGTKEILLTLSKDADSLGQQCSKEAIEEHVTKLYEERLSKMKSLAEGHFINLKQSIARIVEKIKQATTLFEEIDEHHAKINAALKYGYKTIQLAIKEYLKVAEKGLGDLDIETVKAELEPLTKFDSDQSMFSVTMYNDDLERDMKVICSDETEEDDIKQHCITILQAVRALPARWKS